MNRTIVFFILIIVPASLYSDEVQQTDWSGGSGVPGPVFYWSNLFYTSTDMRWNEFPGQLKLFPINIRFTICEYSSKAYSVYSIDVDGDGDKDVLVAAPSNGFTWWENSDGSGTNWVEHIIDENFTWACSVFSTDIDGDGDNDVIGCGDDEIAWWENDDGSGSSWVKHIIDDSLWVAISVYSADIDSDGYKDVLGADLYADNITWWKNVDGSGIYWIEHTIDDNFDGAYSVFSTDIDGDGDMDILGAAIWDDDITWWENIDGSGINWVEHIIDENFSWACSVFSTDIDGDGDNDVLGAAAGDNDIAWWENVNGSGINWVEHRVADSFYGAYSVYSTDVDIDGDNDILGAARWDNGILWWENLDGSGSSWLEHIVDDNFTGYSVYCTDIDNDGNNDVIGAGYVSPNGVVAWWGPDLYTTNGILESSILDTRTDPAWQTIDWNCSTPVNTSVFFQVRASDDSGNMGEWSDTLMNPCDLDGILAEGDSYVQYRAMLNVMNSDSTPILFDVTLAWDPPLSIGETAEPIPAGTSLLLISPNPARGTPVIRFGLPETASVEISIFDLSGRLVSETHGDEYSQGYHNVQFDDFSPGIYFCRMVSGDFTATQRFVVIE